MDAASFSRDLYRRLAMDPILRADVRRYLDEVYPEQSAPQSKRRERPSAIDLLREIGMLDDATALEEVQRAAGERLRKRRHSPDVADYINNVPELSKVPGLRNWAALAEHLQIEVGGDSARRSVARWVAMNKPKWPPVEDPRNPG